MDIAQKLKDVGIEHFYIDREHGVVHVFFEGLLTKETPSQTKERRKREFWERYVWDGFGMKRK